MCLEEILMETSSVPDDLLCASRVSVVINRFCPVHAYHENACLLCEEEAREGFQTCEAHASNETAWERYQYRGSYNLRRRAAAAGEEYEVSENKLAGDADWRDTECAYMYML